MKVAAYIIIGAVLMFIILHVIGKSMMAAYNAGEQNSTDNSNQALDAQGLAAKGYNADEIASLMSSVNYKNG